MRIRIRDQAPPTSFFSAGRRKVVALGFGALGALLAAGACDVPSEAPEWETRWVLPGEETYISVQEFLPEGVFVVPGGEGFGALVPPVEFSRSLAQLCPACIPLDGVTVPKPPFTARFGEDLFLPAEVVSGSVVGGTLSLSLVNGLPFDPLNPGGPGAGALRLSLLAGSGQQKGEIGYGELLGPADSLPAGSGGRVTAPISGTLLDPVELEVELISPSGDPVRIDIEDEIGAIATVADLLLSAIQIDASNRTVAILPVSLDVADLDQEFVDRVESGQIHLDVSNPLAATLDAQIVIRTPGAAPITRELTIPPGASQPSLDFSGAELKTILGRPETILEGSATVVGSAILLLAPDTRVTLRGELDLVVRIGS